MIIATGWETGLPNCLVDAIHFVEREAAAYDAEAVKNMLKKQQEEGRVPECGEGPKALVKIQLVWGCPRNPHAR